MHRLSGNKRAVCVVRVARRGAAFLGRAPRGPLSSPPMSGPRMQVGAKPARSGQQVVTPERAPASSSRETGVPPQPHFGESNPVGVGCCTHIVHLLGASFFLGRRGRSRLRPRLHPQALALRAPQRRLKTSRAFAAPAAGRHPPAVILAPAHVGGGGGTASAAVRASHSGASKSFLSVRPTASTACAAHA